MQGEGEGDLSARGKLWAGKCPWSLRGGRDAGLAPQVPVVTLLQDSDPLCFIFEMWGWFEGTEQPPPLFEDPTNSREKNTQRSGTGPTF